MQNKKKNNLPWRKYAEITGIIIEMIIIIGGFVYGGIWLDEQKFIDFPLFSIVLSLAGVAIAMYLLIKQANRD